MDVCCAGDALPELDPVIILGLARGIPFKDVVRIAYQRDDDMVVHRFGQQEGASALRDRCTVNDHAIGGTIDKLADHIGPYGLELDGDQPLAGYRKGNLVGAGPAGQRPLLGGQHPRGGVELGSWP